MKRTKQQRICACFDAYQALVGGRPCTAEEVSEWVMGCGLWPVPTVRDPPAIQDGWDNSLARSATQPLDEITHERKTR